MPRKSRFENLLAEAELLPAKILTKSPTPKGARLLRAARLLMLSRRYDDAAYLYGVRLNRIASDPIALAELALVFAQSGQLERATELRRQMLGSLPEDIGDEVSAFIRSGRAVENEAGSMDNRSPISSRVEVFVFTNATSKLRRNARLGPPSVGLLEQTMSSATTRLGLNSAKVTVMLDMQNTELDVAYLGSLRNYCEAAGYDLQIRERLGLRRMWLEAIALVRGQYILLIEHDWSFDKRCPALAAMVQVMDARSDVKHIRLNKRANMPAGIDRMLIQLALNLEQNLTGVVSFSNNPCLMRAKALREMICPMISGSLVYDAGNMGAGGVEENVARHMRQLIRWIGPIATQNIYGTYLWGGIGDGPFIEHLGV